MRKPTLVLSVLVLLMPLAGCAPKTESSLSSGSAVSSDVISPSDATIYDNEMKQCFSFFYNSVSSNEASPAYGLVADRARGNIASTASTGFGLAALPIGSERGWVSKEDAQKRALITLKNINKITNKDGFYWHFIYMDDATRPNGSEVSSIDTAIMVFGALVAGQYFGGEVAQEASTLYARVNWKSFLGVNRGKSQFRMAYNVDSSSYAGYWDYYAEQLMLYILGAGAPNSDYRTGLAEYQGFTKPTGSYGQSGDFIYSWFGSLFTYQYSHAFIDFRHLKDGAGISWWDNSVAASKAAYQWCVDNKATYPTYGEDSWGLTACDTMWGYNGYLGNQPRNWQPDDNYRNKAACTIAPCGALGSMPFTPEYSLKALRHYVTVSGLSGVYGLFDAYDVTHDWTAVSYIGIDKGVSLLMMDNYRYGTTWSLVDKISVIREGLSRCGFQEE